MSLSSFVEPIADPTSALSPSPAGLPAPERASTRSTLFAALALAGIVGVFSYRAGVIAWNDSVTSDEITHLIRSLHYWQTGDDQEMWKLGAPRWPHLLNAWPAFQTLRTMGILSPAQRDPEAIRVIESYVLSRTHKILFPARAVAITWGILLLLAVFLAVLRESGPFAAVAVTAAVSLIPEVIAHSAIAGSDMSFTMLGFAAILCLARHAEKPSALTWLSASAAIGLAWATRHSALVLLLVAYLANVRLPISQRTVRTPQPLFERLTFAFFSTAGMGAAAFLFLWAGDGFQTITLGKMAEHVTRFQVPDRIGPIDLSALPIPTSAVSVLKQMSHQAQGHDAYFLGETGRRGWPLYFPIALLLKTPLGLLGLYILAAAAARPRGAREILCLAGLGILWLTLIKNHVNIGLRYALLTYPLLAITLGRLFEPAIRSDRMRRALAIAAFGALAYSSIAAGDRCLSYFNEVTGGTTNAWAYLADSNLDWGQDFDRLTDALKRLDLKEVTIDVCTERKLREPWIYALPFPAKEYQTPATTPKNRRLYCNDGTYLPVYTRYYAVSVSRLLGLYSQNDVSWLRTRKLVERIGDSIFLFDLDSPADPANDPFGAFTGVIPATLK